MNSSIDLANLIQINKVLFIFINQLIAERGFFYSPFIGMLNRRANDLNSNKNELTGLLAGIERRDEFTGNDALNEWKNDVKFQHSTDGDPKTLEFEHSVVAAIEAYKIVLNTSSLTSCIKRSILMDHKYFLQRFLIDLIKYRELNMSVQKTVLSV